MFALLFEEFDIKVLFKLCLVQTVQVTRLVFVAIAGEFDITLNQGVGTDTQFHTISQT